MQALSYLSPPPQKNWFKCAEKEHAVSNKWDNGEALGVEEEIDLLTAAFPKRCCKAFWLTDQFHIGLHCENNKHN